MKLLALMKKEFARFFGDPKLLVTMILPGVLIYFIYSVMGSAIFGGTEPQTYAFTVYVSGESAVTRTIQSAVEENGWTAEFLAIPAEGAQTVDEAAEKVNSGEATALLVFSEDFDDAIAGGGTASVMPSADNV